MFSRMVGEYGPRKKLHCHLTWLDIQAGASTEMLNLTILPKFKGDIP